MTRSATNVVFCALAMAAIGGCSQIEPTKPQPCDAPENAARYQRVLSRYIIEHGVNYQLLKKDTDDLERYVDTLACFGPQMTPQHFTDKNSRLAYWINAHNAIALLDAVKKYPCKTVQPWLGSYTKHVTAIVDGRRLNLDQIAQLARTAGDNDPRIGLTLRLPAKGSGRVPNAPFEPENVDQQLNEQLKQAVDDPHLVKIDHENLALVLAPAIYDVRGQYLQRYRRNYQTDSGTMLNVLTAVADAHQRRKLNRAVGYRIRRMQYDWSLNEWFRPKCSLD